MEEATVEMSTTYVVRKRGRLTMELGVVMTRQNFGFHCSFFVLSLSVCQGKGDEVDTGAGALSEAMTQRERERLRGGVSFVVSLFLYLSFSRARRDAEGSTTQKEAVKMVERGSGLRGIRW